MPVKKKASSTANTTKSSSAARNNVKLLNQSTNNSSINLNGRELKDKTGVAGGYSKLDRLNDTTASEYDLGYSSFELQAMLDNFELDASSKLTALRKNQALRLEAMQRHWTTAVDSLDSRIKQMSLQKFYSDYNGDKEAALRGAVTTQLRRDQGPMSQVEQSARKRKRAETKSPANALDGEADVFGGAVGSLSKKARGPQSVSKSRLGDAAQRSSRLRSATTTAATPSGTVRKPRLRLRPSTAATHQDANSSSAANFVYSASDFNPHLPTTPSVRMSTQAGGRARQPRRGESIVLQSVNGSPLGEFVASDVEDDSHAGPGGDEDWDLMDKNEASRAEDMPGAGKAKNKSASSRSNGGKGKGKAAQSAASLSKAGATTTRKSSRSRSSSLSTTGVSAPTASAFAVAMPADAPSFIELKERIVAGMRADLERRVMSSQERKVLVESLDNFVRSGM